MSCFASFRPRRYRRTCHGCLPCRRGWRGPSERAGSGRSSRRRRILGWTRERERLRPALVSPDFLPARIARCHAGSRARGGSRAVLSSDDSDVPCRLPRAGTSTGLGPTDTLPSGPSPLPQVCPRRRTDLFPSGGARQETKEVGDPTGKVRPARSACVLRRLAARDAEELRWKTPTVGPKYRPYWYVKEVSQTRRPTGRSWEPDASRAGASGGVSQGARVDVSRRESGSRAPDSGGGSRRPSSAGSRHAMPTRESSRGTSSSVSSLGRRSLCRGRGLELIRGEAPWPIEDTVLSVGSRLCPLAAGWIRHKHALFACGWPTRAQTRRRLIGPPAVPMRSLPPTPRPREGVGSGDVTGSRSFAASGDGSFSRGPGVACFAGADEPGDPHRSGDGRAAPASHEKASRAEQETSEGGSLGSEPIVGTELAGQESLLSFERPRAARPSARTFSRHVSPLSPLSPRPELVPPRPCFP